MGKPTSTSPRTSKSVQPRSTVQKQVVQRILELRNSGMGFRRISKRLEKEGIATISKSTVANYWDQAQTQSKISAKKLHEDPALRVLAKTEARLQKQVNQIQAVTQARQRVQDLQLQRAETPEGRQDIFKNSEELKEFAQQTLPESQTLKAFELHCREKGLPLAKTLSDVVGSLGKYEAENEDSCMWPDLSSYIEEQLDIFLMGEQKRERQVQLQNKFSDALLHFRCSNCDAPYETMWIYSSTCEIQCKCGSSYKPLCVECRSELVYDDNTEAFSCRKCNAIFKRPTLNYRDYISLREPADFSVGDSCKDTPF